MLHFVQVAKGITLKPVTEAIYREVDGKLVEVDQRIADSQQYVEEDNSLNNLLY
jgi:hypothetical protein